MAEIQPPQFAAGECYTSQQDRMMWASIVCAEGVVGDGDLAVTSGAGMSVDVAVGRAFVQGDSIQNQGVYHVWNSGSVTLGLATSDPTDDRIDLVVAKVYDAEYEGATTYWALEVITGGASPVPVAPALPPTALPLAEVLVTAGSTTVSQVNITDLRTLYTQCGGHGQSQPIELGVVDLNTIVEPGFYTQSATNEATNGANYPPGPALQAYQSQGGMLEVQASYNFVSQRYTEYRQDLFVVWQRQAYLGDWGEWYATGGPGDWSITPITPTADVANLRAITGSVNRGVNRVGAIALEFDFVGTPATADADGNFSTILLMSIDVPTYRPVREVDIAITQRAVGTFYGVINSAGNVYATHASFPGQIFGNNAYRIQTQWTVS